MSDSPLHVVTIVSAPFEENTYVAHLDGRTDCLVFDPGLEPDQIAAYLDEKGLTPAALMITHGHADHIAGNAFMKERWPQCPIVIGQGDAAKLTDAELNLSAPMGLPVTSPPADVMLAHGDKYSAAGFDLDVCEIPGHSSGHVVYILRNHEPPIVFGGDVLFAQSIGRTDFPDGSFEKLAAGIREHLFTLPDDTVVLSGHGPATTVGREKRLNPFVGEGAGTR